ncbi:MAG: ABC transporter substrate-binding protein [Burkholderiaceae bacterium]|jgi:NitT/TauT family transport system substrate-binding protein|nr:ABC transporter substrate-binding protein [Burkholderiaceae bacterium]
MIFDSIARRIASPLAWLAFFLVSAFAVAATAQAQPGSSVLVAANGATSTGASSDRPLRKVRLAYGVRVIGPDAAAYTSAPKKEGFWEREGLDVDIQSLDTGPAFQLLAQDKLDFLIAGSGSGMPLVENGALIKAIAASYKLNIFYPAVLESSGMKSLRELKGKKVGLFTPAGSAVIMLDAVLHEYGLTKDDLAAVVTIGTGAPAINALKTGQVDVYFGYQGAYNTIEATTDVRFRRFNEDPLFLRTAFASPGVWTRTVLIEKEPKMVADFLRGITAGIAFSKKNPEAAVEDHFALYPQTRPAGERSKELAVDALVKNLATFSDPYGLVSEENVTATAQVMNRAGVIKKVEPASRYYTSEFIESANRVDGHGGK